MKMIVFWDMAPCILVEIDQRLRGVQFLHYQDDNDDDDDEGSTHL
jgi:hypothetical protein